MVGTSAARGGLAWVILGAALAVPSVLFYNWRSHLQGERERAVAAKARGRIPDRGGVFQSSPNAKLVNPMAPNVESRSVSPAPVPATASVPRAAVDAATAGVVVADVRLMGSSAATQPPSYLSASVPTLKRDPMLSAFDLVRIREGEEARRRAAEDLENAAKFKPDAMRARSTASLKALVELQGIVSNPESGYRAIVNNDVVRAGQYVGKTKIRVITIGDKGVTFEYRGKRFTKTVSQ